MQNLENLTVRRQKLLPVHQGTISILKIKINIHLFSAT
jgi:hypothetical protein